MRFIRVLQSLILILCLTGGLVIAAGRDDSGTGKNLSAESWQLFQRAYGMVLRDYVDPKSPEAVMSGALQGIAEAAGPECAYIPPDEKAAYLSALLHGPSLPVYVTKKSDFAVVLAFFPDIKEKVNPGDSLRFIGDRSTYDLTYPQILVQLRKKYGKPVKCTFINRDSWQSTSVVLSPELPVKPKWTPLEGGGVLSIPCLEANLDEKEAALLKNTRGTILVDLRGAASGDSGEALKWLGILLGPGRSPERKRGKNSFFDSVTGPGVLKGKHIVVLMNKTTARAGEVLVSGLMQNGAKTVGGETFGWAPRVENFSLENGGIMRLSTAFYLKPDGKAINGSPIEPDVFMTRAAQEGNLHFYARVLRKVGPKKGA